MALLTTGKDARPSHRWKPWLGWLLAIGAGLLGASVPAANPAAPREYQLKAIFMFNFAQFVEWPAAAFPEPTSPLVIGVLGDDPFGASLDEVVRDEKVGARPLLVRRYRHIGEIDSCHILFISHSERANLEEIVTRLQSSHVLTVSDTEGFALRGVMIRFITEKGKIRLRINLDSAKAAGLTISSKLLRPAEIVTSKKD